MPAIKSAVASLRHRAAPNLRDLAVNSLAATGSLKRARQEAAERRCTFVLTLHRIVPDAELARCRSPRGMVLRESLFVRLLAYLNETASVLTPSQYRQSDDTYTGRPKILLTFDDGWIDNILVARSHLERASIRACFFVTTGLLAKAQPFWPEQAMALLHRARARGEMHLLENSLKQLQGFSSTAPPAIGSASMDERLLCWLKQFPAAMLMAWVESCTERMGRQSETTAHHDHARNGDAASLGMVDSIESIDPMERLMEWSHLRSLVAGGHSIGSHTCTHAILPLVSQADCMDELAASRSMILQQLSAQSIGASYTLCAACASWVSYPNGSVSRAVARAACEAGYSLGFANTAGAISADSDPFTLPRVNIWDGTVTDSRGSFCSSRLDYALYWRTAHAATRA